MTKPDSRIQLYDYTRIKQTNTGYRNTSGITEYEHRYFISLPGHPKFEAMDIEGRNLVPNFDEKMSEFVKDKPALAQKIRNKEKGYFYALISLGDERKIETIMRIIDEYDN
jgi:hypothetical protein